MVKCIMMMFQFVLFGKKISFSKKPLVRSSDEKTSYPATWGSAKDAYIGGQRAPCTRYAPGLADGCLSLEIRPDGGLAACVN
jgi:hypothetical protein